MDLPILSGIATDGSPDFRAKYPLNRLPVVMSTGVSVGHLRPWYGIEQRGTGSGIARGAIEWQGAIYAVFGTTLSRIDSDNTVTAIGNVGGTGRVTMTYSFDYLAIASSERLFLYNGDTLVESTDPDLGAVKDIVWIDGYFMTTDGEFLVVNELTNPFAINPLKYGSSEASPDPITALLRLRNEVYALNRYTIEVFDNTGGGGFPFDRIEGGQIQRGCVGVHACTVFNERLAFIGGGQDEAISIWIGENGQARKIATREIDKILSGYTEEQLAGAYLESRVVEDHYHLHVHLPDATWIYDEGASVMLDVPVWFQVSSSIDGAKPWRNVTTVRAFDEWYVFDTETANFGVLTEDISSHWGEKIQWRFTTPLLYADTRGGIIHEMELVALTGSVQIETDASITTRHTLDGEIYSNPKTTPIGRRGERAKRIAWRRMGKMDVYRSQQFSGTSDAHATFAKVVLEVEALAE